MSNNYDKKYYRFMGTDNKLVYINIDNVYSVEVWNSPNVTKIISVSGGHHFVKHHIEEVVAILERRDSTAAAILFSRDE